MNATLGAEMPFTNITNQTTIPLMYIDPPTEILLPSAAGAPLESPLDGTQLWKITHNGVDTHFIHFHLFDVQLVNRVGWDGAIRPPDPNELGWKDTVRMNPLEDCIVAMRPTTPTPAVQGARQRPGAGPDAGRSARAVSSPESIRPPANPITVVNEPYNFGWEYVWHCHILGHEENDMMRPVVYLAAPAGPSGLTGTELTATSVHLSWTDNATNPVAIEMTIQRATNSAFTQNLRTFTTSGTATSYVDAAVGVRPDVLLPGQGGERSQLLGLVEHGHGIHRCRSASAHQPGRADVARRPGREGGPHLGGRNGCQPDRVHRPAGDELSVSRPG